MLRAAFHRRRKRPARRSAPVGPPVLHTVTDVIFGSQTRLDLLRRLRVSRPVTFGRCVAKIVAIYAAAPLTVRTGMRSLNNRGLVLEGAKMQYSLANHSRNALQTCIGLERQT